MPHLYLVEMRQISSNSCGSTNLRPSRSIGLAFTKPITTIHAYAGIAGSNIEPSDLKAEALALFRFYPVRADAIKAP